MAHERGGGGRRGAGAVDLDVDWNLYWSMGNTNHGEPTKRKVDDLDDEDGEEEEPMPEGTNPQELLTYVLEERFLCANERVNRDNKSLVDLINLIAVRRRHVIRIVGKRGLLGRDGKMKLKEITRMLKDAHHLHDGILNRGGTPKPIPLHFQDKKFY